MDPRLDPVPPEKQYAQKSTFESEGKNTFGRECTSKNIAHIPGIHGPVGPELKLHDYTCHHTDTKSKCKNLGPESGQFMVDFLFGPDVDTFKNDQQQT